MQLFADRTYDAILAEMLAQAPAGVDTRQGSIYFDAVAACALKLANFYVDAGCVLDIVFVGTASGEYLDAKGSEFGVSRNPATPARYHYIYDGARPFSGTRFFADGLYFVLEEAGEDLYLSAEEAGESGNGVAEGTNAVPVHSVAGLTVSEFGALVEPGTDRESDESFRTRIQEKMGGPAQNGNKQHYKTWCEEDPGVGRARILPLWNGANTVKGVLLDADGLPAANAVVERVQQYIDPGGLGLGEGAANIGAYFTAVPASAVPVSVSFSVSLATGKTAEQAKAAATEAIAAYLKALALDTADGEAMVVRISSVGALLYALDAVVDYAGLTLNAGTANIEIDQEHVAVLKEVEIVGVV